MKMSQEWMQNISSKLTADDLRLSTLKQIKDYTFTLSRNELLDTASEVPLLIIFDCLNDSNPDQTQLASDILSLCLGCFDLGESINHFAAPLEKALHHPHTPVKLMALNEIKRNIVSDAIIVDLIDRTSLFYNIITCIGCEDLSVAKLASIIVVAASRTNSGIKTIVSDGTKMIFKSLVSANEVIRLRLYETFVKISTISVNNLKLMEADEFLPQILKEMESNDVLLRMNIIELLSQLVITEFGYEYLESQGVTKKLFQQLENNEFFGEICEPGILKFFGHFGHFNPSKMLLEYPVVAVKLAYNIESDNFTLLTVSLDVLGYIAETSNGKIALSSLGGEMNRIVSVIVERLTSLPTESRIRALNCLESLLRVQTDDEQVSEITRNWFSLMSDEPLGWITKYAKNPFHEIRLAGLGILRALSTQMWGHEVIRKSPGLVEFLLDRNIETDKGCKEMKYEIIANLTASPVFDTSINNKFQKFVKEGAFYSQTIMEVAVEGNE